jgi:hypothetical protein
MAIESILGFVRHALTFGGGFFVQSGVATQDEITTGVAAVVTLIGIVWSVLQKKGS